jgi:hypothetical protein
MGQRCQFLVNTYNAIVPHTESNVNVWFGRPFDKLRTDSPQAVRRARSSLLWPLFSALMMRPDALAGTSGAAGDVRLRMTSTSHASRSASHFFSD